MEEGVLREKIGTGSWYETFQTYKKHQYPKMFNIIPRRPSRPLPSPHPAMNRALAVALALAALLIVTWAAPGEEKYTDKYDNINLDEILRNDRLLNKYLECIHAATDAHCTADGKELRNNMQEALTNDCGKCTEKQKSGLDKVIKFLRENKPAEFSKLRAKFDPEDIYLKKFGSS